MCYEFTFYFLFLEIKRREAMSSQMFFETEDNPSSSDLFDMLGNGSSNNYGQQLQMQQSNQTQTFAAILIEEENAKMAAQWEQEANQITSSVVELNNIFKDLAHMVVQQVSCKKIKKNNENYYLIYFKITKFYLISIGKCFGSNRLQYRTD